MSDGARITITPEGMTYYDADGSIGSHVSFTGPTAQTAPTLSYQRVPGVWAAHIPAQPDDVDAVVPLDAPERVYRRTHDEWMGDLWADRFSAGVPWDELMHMWVRGVRRYEPPPCPMCTNTTGGGHSGDLCDDHRARFEAWLAHEYPDG